MTPRTNQHTAMMVDLALILLPLIGTREAGRMMARQGVPAMVAARVLVAPGRRRTAIVLSSGGMSGSSGGFA